MTGRLVVADDAPREEWLAARRQGVTASEIAILMGLAPDSWASPYALYHRKAGALPEQPDTDAMERGRVLEPIVISKFAARYPGLLLTGTGRELYAHPDRTWQLATPDRIAYDGTCACGAEGDVLCSCVLDEVAVVEAKTSATYAGWGDDGTDDIPVWYRCQALWQADVRGVSRALVPCLFVEPWKLRVYEITMDDAAEADLKIMREEAAGFLGCIERGDPPDIDWRPATGDAIRRLHPAVTDRDVPVRRSLAIRYKAACRRYDTAKRRKELMTNRVLDVIGDGRRAVDAGTGERIATRSASQPRRIDASLLRERYPAAAAECTTTPDHPVISLTPAKVAAP